MTTFLGILLVTRKVAETSARTNKQLRNKTEKRVRDNENRCYLYQAAIVGCDESRRVIGHGSCKEMLSLSPPTLNGKDGIQWLDANYNNIQVQVSRLCHFSNHIYEELVAMENTILI